jgi:hypothetical protein
MRFHNNRFSCFFCVAIFYAANATKSQALLQHMQKKLLHQQYTLPVQQPFLAA